VDWKTELSFGKHKGKTLISILASDKEYLAWAFWFRLEEKYPELQWLKDNISTKEMHAILSMPNNNYDR
jgi:hypothetical protein